MTKPIRVRFAPSPTGCLHIGGVRTALYNFLFAKRHRGTFILRIEDTDQKRYVPGAEDYIFESLKWLGLEADEDPIKGGPAGLYRQSERVDIYQKYIRILLERDAAYYAFDTPGELESMRERLEAAKIPSPKYNPATREHMKNSLVMPKDEVDKLINSGTQYVVRLKSSQKKNIRFKDTVRGWIKVQPEELEDKVLMKSDGIPTYHFANVVDDHLMGITHVIRGEEWISSTPTHVLLYELFGWQDTMPEFVHLPLLLKPDGKGKLSKRDASTGLPVFPISWLNPENQETVIGFREEGYLPEALLNFLALMGWNPGHNDEVLTIDRMINEFSLEKIGKSGARFDIRKAQWINSEHIKLIPKELLANKVVEGLNKAGFYTKDTDYVIKICDILKERANFIQEIVQGAVVFFERPRVYETEGLDLVSTKEVLQRLADLLTNLSQFDPATLKNLIHSTSVGRDIKLGQVMLALRLACTGTKSGPEIIKIISLLGKEESIFRIKIAIDSLNSCKRDTP